VNINDFALAVHADAPWETIEELIEYVEENPGKLKMGVTAPGGAWHSAGLAFQNLGYDVELVPYGGGTADMLPSLLGGHLEAGMMDVAEAAPHVESGSIRVLATGGESRYEDLLPGTPTFAERGIEIFRACAMRGLMAPKGTPQEIVDILYEAAYKATQTQAFKDFMDSNGFAIEIFNPTEWAKFLQEQYDDFVELFKTL